MENTTCNPSPTRGVTPLPSTHTKSAYRSFLSVTCGLDEYHRDHLHEVCHLRSGNSSSPTQRSNRRRSHFCISLVIKLFCLTDLGPAIILKTTIVTAVQMLLLDRLTHALISSCWGQIHSSSDSSLCYKPNTLFHICACRGSIWSFFIIIANS